MVSAWFWQCLQSDGLKRNGYCEVLTRFYFKQPGNLKVCYLGRSWQVWKKVSYGKVDRKRGDKDLWYFLSPLFITDCSRLTAPFIDNAHERSITIYHPKWSTHDRLYTTEYRWAWSDNPWDYVEIIGLSRLLES